MTGDRKTGGMGIVDPKPWFKRQRDERIAELERELAAGGDPERIRKAMRAARWDYRRALLARGGWRWF